MSKKVRGRWKRILTIYESTLKRNVNISGNTVIQSKLLVGWYRIKCSYTNSFFVEKEWFFGN